MNSPFDINDLKRIINKTVVGNDIVYFDKTISTNIDAVRLADNGAADGTVVIADEQTGGKGRFDRTWISPACKNILMSIILRPEINISRMFYLTMIASIAVARAIEINFKIKPEIKWPNDVYVNGEKVSGILTEINTEKNRLNYAVVGIGLNVNAHPEIEDLFFARAVSIASIIGEETSRTEITASILIEMDSLYRDLNAGNFDSVKNDWVKRSMVIGKQVRIIDADRTYEGKAVNIDEEGRLILMLKNGSHEVISSGDVSLKFT